MYIAVAGNIGSGKTTLTELLSKHYGWEAHYEEVDDNPYLDDFYKDMQRWSFNLQVYFLNKRLQEMLKVKSSNNTVIQDRTIYEDAHIFAANLNDMGLMETRDFNTYSSLFVRISSFITPPDLLIYLRASVPVLVNQIQKRGRPFEASIRIDYLQRLNERYEAWISKYQLGKILIIDVDKVKFSETKEDLRYVINKIDAAQHGLF
ncbi:MAG: deoxynucleoside kinase [Bacteroidales bacterium]|nr:deoxynucleoside kinase [Bacteroidales bacterium]